jgi:hypothetical protein
MWCLYFDDKSCKMTKRWSGENMEDMRMISGKSKEGRP